MGIYLFRKRLVTFILYTTWNDITEVPKKKKVFIVNLPNFFISPYFDLGLKTSLYIPLTRSLTTCYL